MKRHKKKLDEWLESSEESKYAEWSETVLKLGLGLDYSSWCRLHEEELWVAAGIESKINTPVERNGVWV